MKIIIILAILFTAYCLLLTSPVYAAVEGGGGGNPPKTADFGPPAAGLNELEGTVANVISVIVGLGFVALLLLLFWTGIKYLTSGGEPKAVQSAHYTATWALLGIVFLAIAWLILQLLQGFTGVNVTTFDIKALCGKTFEFCK